MTCAMTPWLSMSAAILSGEVFVLLYSSTAPSAIIITVFLETSNRFGEVRLKELVRLHILSQ